MEAKEFNQLLIERLAAGKSIKSVVKRVPLDALLKLQDTVNEEVERKNAIEASEQAEREAKAKKVAKAKELLAELDLNVGDLTE